MNVTVIVPSLNPDEKLIEVIDGLIKSEFDSIIVVDDGSSKEYEGYFDRVKKYPQCTVLRHAKNLGKGRALKTAFNYYLNNIDNLGVITVDADNQHKPKDILSCTKELEKNPDFLILGVRNFNLKHVPPRSKYGNKLTSYVFKIACGLNISDTQTGLRAIPAKHLYSFIDLYGERFEYETNMLLELKSLDIGFKEVEIETVYIEDNKSSHFNPFLDSIKISRILFKFLFASILSSAIDLTAFALISLLTAGMELSKGIFIATAAARIISSASNYFLNKNAVFSSNVNLSASLVKYYIICVFQMLASFAGVYFIKSIVDFPAVAIKIFVDLILFIISFNIQREWVFRK